MHKYYPQPTVIGSGLTGLLISNALTKARIGHVLIGGPPPEGSPRLGESLNLEATIYFLAEYPELADYYYEKAFAAVYTGDISGKFLFSFLHTPQIKSTLGLWGKQAPNALIHFDRVGLDAAMYEKAINSPYCTHLDARVAQINCFSGTDRIEQLILDDGSTLPVSHVFDATGFIRLVARQLNIQRRMLGPTQYAVYAHYFRGEEAERDVRDAAWKHGTNIVRLYPEVDGIQALAWSIPLGNTISVGITTPITAAPGMDSLPTDEALLQSAHEAFVRYGVTYLDECTDRSQVGKAKMEFYTHAQGSGPNWLLTSAANTQVWWPTSGGIDTSVAAANAAVPFLTRPETVGARYQEYLIPLIRSQQLWNWTATHSHCEMTDADANKFAKRLYWSISHRSLHAFAMEKQNFFTQTAATAAARFWGNEIWSRLPSPVVVTNVDE